MLVLSRRTGGKLFHASLQIHEKQHLPGAVSMHPVSADNSRG